MSCDPVNWSCMHAHEFILWYRTHKSRHHWRAAGVAQRDVCESLAAKMLAHYPKRSVVVLPKYETPLLETAQ